MRGVWAVLCWRELRSSKTPLFLGLKVISSLTTLLESASLASLMMFEDQSSAGDILQRKDTQSLLRRYLNFVEDAKRFGCYGVCLN